MPSGSPISSAMPRPLLEPDDGQVLADQRFDERRRQARFLDRVRRAGQEFFFRLDCRQEFFVQRSGGHGRHHDILSTRVKREFSEELYVTPRSVARDVFSRAEFAGSVAFWGWSGNPMLCRRSTRVGMLPRLAVLALEQARGGRIAGNLPRVGVPTHGRCRSRRRSWQAARWRSNGRRRPASRWAAAACGPR